MIPPKLSRKEITKAKALLELFAWWYPARLVDETGLKIDRVKYLCKLAKELESYSEVNAT